MNKPQNESPKHRPARDWINRHVCKWRGHDWIYELTPGEPHPLDHGFRRDRHCLRCNRLEAADHRIAIMALKGIEAASSSAAEAIARFTAAVEELGIEEQDLP